MTQLPDSWTTSALSEVALVVQGQSPPGSTYNTQGNGLPFFQGKAEFGATNPTAVKWCTSPVKIAEPDDVLISVRAPVGPTNLADTKCCIGRGLGAIRPFGGAPSKFLFYYLQHSVSLLAKQATGTTFKAISGKQLREHPVVVPPLGEQDRIVESVESYFTRLDDAVATLERVQRNLKRYRASVLQTAVEGRLVPTEAELARAEGRDYEPASALLDRILAERRRRWEEAELAKMTAKGKAPKDDKWKAKYMAPDPLDTSALPGLPEGWCWASMDQLTTRITSGSRDWSKYYDRGDSIFLMAQNVRPGRLDLSWQQFVDPPPDDSSCERSQVLIGDLLVTIVGANTGDVCRVLTELPRHYVCQSVALMRPVEAGTSCYLDIYLNSPPGQRIYEEFMYGQGRPHLSFDNLKGTVVPLPPLSEQTRIVDAVEETQSIVEAASTSVEENGSRCSRLRQSILKWAFEGKLVDQDPADESASVLLERIRAEREAAEAERPKGRARRKAKKKTKARKA